MLYLTSFNSFINTKFICTKRKNVHKHTIRKSKSYVTVLPFALYSCFIGSSDNFSSVIFPIFFAVNILKDMVGYLNFGNIFFRAS